MYNLIIRPLLFCIDPEKVHRMLLSWLKFYRYLFPVRACVRGYSRVSDPFSYGHLQFKNRIGLSAGFDKNAEAFDELADFGFGFLEVGTVTPDSQSGNPSPRIFRLVDDESLISRTGFNNCGVRYKMFLVARESGKWRYHYKTSPDGKVWRAAVQSEPIADRSTVYKNPFRNVWVYSMRHNVRLDANKLVRARDYNENADPEAGTKKAEALLSAFWFGPWANEQHHTDYPNIAPAIYNQDATPYESIMLGFFSVWQGPENDVCASDNVIKRNQVMVGYSRDGYSWFREDMNPFHAVNTTTSDAWNQGNLQSVAGAPLIIGDKLYFYLSGRRLRGTQEITTTGLATLRRDGFASMKGTGELQTPLLKFDGSYFFVNANVTGKMKVELLDSNNKVIEGFSKDECKAFKGDNVKAKIEWTGNASLASLKNKQLKVKFYIDNGEIFAFWISPSANGESMGYTAGGGPGLNISGIDKTN